MIPDASPPEEVMPECACNPLDSVKIEHTLSATQKEKLKSLIKEFSDIFKLDPTPETRAHGVMHQIKLKPGTNPIACKPFPMSSFLHSETKKVTDLLLKAGMIRPGSGPWAFPVVMVRKPGGKHWRMCVDFRKLNKVTVKDKWPFPRIQDLHHSLRGSSIFSTMDALAGFWQILVDPRDRAKTAFVTRHGLFEWNVMPMGLSNSPATFQRMMESVLTGMLHQFVLCYIDDVCVHSDNFDEHLAHLRRVFERFRQHHLALKPSKCHFGFSELKFLGWMASGSGIRPNPEKIEAILKFGTPTTIRELRSFLGMASWFRDSVKNFAMLAAPLTSQLKGPQGEKRRRLKWNEESEKSFQAIKEAMAKQTFLHHPDPNKPFLVDCDASDVGVGAVLFQLDDEGKERPIVFVSRSLSAAERKWDASEKEAFAVIWALRDKLRPFLMGHAPGFTVFTDHANLFFLLRQKKGRLARWGLTLAEFACDMKLVHKKGAKNKVADALSRDPRFVKVEHPAEILAQPATTSTLSFTTENVRKGQLRDPFWKILISHLEGNDFPSDLPKQFRDKVKAAAQHHTLDESGLLRFSSAPSFVFFEGAEAPVCLPKEFRETVINEHHRLTHDGVNRMHASISSRFWWKGMRKQIRAHVRSCVPCQKAKATLHSRAHLTRPKTFRKPWDVVGIDFFGPLPRTSSGNRFVLTVVDAFTRFTILFALPEATSEAACKALKFIFCIFGFPRVIHSDRGSQFTSRLFQHICQRLRIKHTVTPPWHPQGNGFTERFHRFLKVRLRIQLDQVGKEWDAWLGPIALAHNQGVLATTKFSPCQLTFGRSPNFTPLDLKNPLAEQTKDLQLFGEELVSMLQDSWKKAQEDFRWAKEQQSRSANAAVPPRKPHNFQVGDLALLHRPMRSDAKRLLSSKLRFEWKGPFRLIEQLNDSVFKLMNLKTGQEVDAIHVDQLQLFIGDPLEELHEEPTNMKDPGPLKRNELLLIRTDSGIFPAKVLETPEEDERLIAIQWLNSHSKHTLPLPRRRWKESHVDPADGKCVFTNRPPPHFEPEQGIVRRDKIAMRHLKLRKNGTFDAESDLRFSKTYQEDS